MTMKRKLIQLLDWCDAHILHHRVEWVCRRIFHSSWWYDEDVFRKVK